MQPPSLRSDIINVAFSTAYKVLTAISATSQWCCIVFASSIPLLADHVLAVYAFAHQGQRQTERTLLTSRYCASARRIPPPSFLIILVWAAPPTRDTDKPALIAGRKPELNKSEFLRRSGHL